MHILHIIENIDNRYGGPAKSVPFLVKYLNKLKVNNKIISTKIYDKEKNDICEKNNIDVLKTEINGPIIFKYSKDLCKLILSNLDSSVIIHTHSLWNYVPYCAYKVSKNYNIPLVMSIRGNLYEWNLNKSKWKKIIALKFFQMKMFKEANCLHATEEKEIEAIRKLGIKTPIALIPNGIELSEFDDLDSKEISVKRLKLDNNKRYILFMSRIDRKKGLHFLVRSFGRIHSQFSEWELLIAGPIYDNNYFNEIKGDIKKMGIEKKVHYFGMVSGQKRLDLFAVSDIFVLPAYTENFGMVIGEAMASKLPVITTTGTPWKILNNKKAGWCIELNLNNLEKTLIEAMNKSPEELKYMGINGYEIIQEFKWEKVSYQMKQVYEWILKKRNKPKFIFED